jgi:TetR/AcrR family transcriptional repressor of lmrAB and yxaGH operons
MARDTRQRLIDAAQRLVASNGSHGSSFADILAASGAPRGSIYHHFPGGKEELMLEAVDAANTWAIKQVAQLRGQSAVGVADGFVDMWRTLLTAAGYTIGCAIAGITVDSESKLLVERGGEVFHSWRTLLSELLLEGGARADRAEPLASLLIAACEGAVIVARAQQDMKAFEQVAGQLHDLVVASTAASA